MYQEKRGKGIAPKKGGGEYFLQQGERGGLMEKGKGKDNRQVEKESQKWREN